MRFSFRGGIRPPGNKESTANIRFTNLPVPHHCAIPLLQHAGTPARPIVQPGDIVSEGQRIGEAQGGISAHVHASIPGKVRDIAMVPTVNDPQLSIIIDAGGSFGASTQQQRADDWTAMDAGEIRRRVIEGGLVGLGGAAYPTGLKLDPAAGRAIEILMVNGVECEPYLTADDRLMQTFPADIIEGTRIVMKALGARRAIIALQRRSRSAVSALHTALNAETAGAISVRTLSSRYPQGAERQLVYSLTRRRIPPTGMVRDAGVTVLNVATVYAIREAVLFGKPLFERYCTVSGGAIAQPGNYKVRIGTLLSDIVNECGGLREEPARIVMGGPLGGTGVTSLDVPVIKSTTGLLFLSRREVSRGQSQTCIRCGRCVTACPMGLLPCDIGTAVERKRFEQAYSLGPAACIRCGACAYVCPARRPLVHLIDAGREPITGIGGPNQ